MLYGCHMAQPNQMREVRVYSHNEPIGHRKRGYILTMDQSDTGSAGIFSRWTNRTQEARVYYVHVEPRNPQRVLGRLLDAYNNSINPLKRVFSET
eukprot:1177778-Prorocentrum_minimum.AAC.3